MDEFNGFIKRKYNLGGWRKKQEKKKKKTLQNQSMSKHMSTELSKKIVLPEWDI